MTVIYSKEKVPKGTQCEGNNNKQSWRGSASRGSYSLHPSLSFVPKKKHQPDYRYTILYRSLFGLVQKRVMDPYYPNETRSCFNNIMVYVLSVCLFVLLS